MRGGGLKDIDIELKIKALKLSWIRRLYDETEHEWKIIPKFFIEKLSKNIFFPNLKVNIKNKLPTFYKNMIREWESLADCDPLTIENVLFQSIRFNSKILINGSVITWHDASELFVNNFYDELGRIMDWEVFKHKNGKNDNFFFKWRQILDSIPRGWKGIIARESASGQSYANPEPHLQVISRKIFLDRLSGKEIYILLINKIWEKPTSEGKIEQQLSLNSLNWSKIYMLGRKMTLDSYSRQFHFKLTHNILFLNKALKRMKLVNSSMCSYCNAVEETPVHLFAECQNVISLWGHVQEFFRSKLVLFDLTPQSAILGWDQEDNFSILKNQILLIFKMIVYKDRELGRSNLNRIINKLKLVRAIEFGISTNNDYNNMKWEPVREIFE